MNAEKDSEARVEARSGASTSREERGTLAGLRQPEITDFLEKIGLERW